MGKADIVMKSDRESMDPGESGMLFFYCSAPMPT